MVLQNGAEKVLHFFSLKNGEQNFLVSVGVNIEAANGDLAQCDTVDDNNLDDIFSTSFDVGQYREMLVTGEYPHRTGRKFYYTHCKKSPCRETAGIKITRGSSKSLLVMKR